jgi:hypothetical protein
MEIEWKFRTVNGESRIGFFALSDIEESEEITIDYQFQKIGGSLRSQKCLCGSKECRGFVGGSNPFSQPRVRSMEEIMEIERVRSERALEVALLRHVEEMKRTIRWMHRWRPRSLRVMRVPKSICGKYGVLMRRNVLQGRSQRMIEFQKTRKEVEIEFETREKGSMTEFYISQDELERQLRWMEEFQRMRGRRSKSFSSVDSHVYTPQ